MRRGILALCGLTLLMAVGLVQAPSALAVVTCSGMNTHLTGTVQGPVIVPSGASCSIFSATVNGSVTVQPGGRLTIADSTIKGNVTFDNPFGGPCESPCSNSNAICGVTLITENLTVTNAGPEAVVDIGPQTETCDGGGADPVTIQGNVSINANRAGSLVDLGGAKVGGNVSVTNNRGQTIVDSNKIGNILNCTGNVPPPTGTGNTARLFAGQCVGFGGGGIS